VQVRRPDSQDARAFGELRDLPMVLLAVVVKVFRTGVIVERDALERPPTPKDPWTLPKSIFKPRMKVSVVNFAVRISNRFELRVNSHRTLQWESWGGIEQGYEKELRNWDGKLGDH